MKTFSEFMEEIMEFTAVKKRMDKGADAKKRRREDKLNYKKNKIKIKMARKKRKKKDDSSGVTKKRDRMAAQGKTLSGDRQTKRIK
ncbi:MAG TPA: hypothetical protein EYF95_03320 [Flavobacteriales bacterium]|jgi:hypothetical protein|nr:hypothetical protein [Flavobacteriales bacterium]